MIRWALILVLLCPELRPFAGAIGLHEGMRPHEDAVSYGSPAHTHTALQQGRQAERRDLREGEEQGDTCAEFRTGKYGRCNVQHACHATGLLGSAPVETWQDLELFVRTTATLAGQLEDILMRSLLMFWPLEQLRLVVVLDGDSAADVAWKPDLEDALARTGMASWAVFLEDPSDFYEGGHSRQQWSMFWADKYATSEFVGFIDTDTLFTSVVHPRALWENGRPLVFGGVGRRMSEFWNKVARTTEKVLQKPEVMCGMMYFPIIMRVSHLVELRSHIANLAGETSFDVAFAKFSKTLDLGRTYFTPNKLGNESYSQFSIMANYVFYHKHCDYSFAFEELKPGVRQVSRGQTGCLDHILDYVNTAPRARIATHFYHRATMVNPQDVPRYIREGYCRSGGTAEAAGCAEWPSNTLHSLLFEFEDHEWTWNPMCRHAQIKHYEAVKAAHHSWPRDVELLLGLAGRASG